MKTIAGILMLAILVGSLFAGLGFANAQEVESGVSVDAAEFATSEVDSEEVRDAFRRASESDDSELRKSGFAMVWRGIGHIENGREGYLVNTFWVEQQFAITNADASEILKEEFRAFGSLEIVGEDAHYRLVAGEVSDDTMRFYVVGRSEVVDDADEAERAKMGILELKKVAEFSGLSKWEGTLEMRDGDFEGKWNVDIAAASKSLKASSDSDKNAAEIQSRAELREADASENRIAANDETQVESTERTQDNEDRTGFFERFFGFFRS